MREREMSDYSVDVYDLFAYVTKKHNDKTSLSETFVLADLDDRERRFIREQSLVAESWKKFIKSTEFADDGFDFLMKDLTNLARLSIGKQGRVINSWADFFTSQRETETRKDTGFFEGLKRIFGKSEEGE